MLLLGNILINVGPTKEGVIAPIFQERLLNLGNWLSVNGEAIYGSTPWKVQNDSLSKVWYTKGKTEVYAIVLSWPEKNILRLGSASKLFITNNVLITMLGYSEQLPV